MWSFLEGSWLLPYSSWFKTWSLYPLVGGHLTFERGYVCTIIPKKMTPGKPTWQMDTKHVDFQDFHVSLLRVPFFVHRLGSTETITYWFKVDIAKVKSGLPSNVWIDVFTPLWSGFWQEFQTIDWIFNSETQISNEKRAPGSLGYIYMGARCPFLVPPPHPHGMVPPIPHSTGSNSSSASTSTT